MAAQSETEISRAGWRGSCPGNGAAPLAATRLMYKCALHFVSRLQHRRRSNHFRRVSTLRMLQSSFRMRNTAGRVSSAGSRKEGISSEQVGARKQGTHKECLAGWCEFGKLSVFRGKHDRQNPDGLLRVRSGLRCLCSAWCRNSRSSRKCARRCARRLRSRAPRMDRCPA